jgi:RNA-directed DNA polymerase
MNIFDDLCESLCLSKDELLCFASTSPHRYKVYSIDKRNSKGKRTIAHPSKELKFIQRYLIKRLANDLKVHDSAYAYKKKISIKDNAKQHLHSKYLLKMDFTDFFPSISPELFFKCTKNSGINYNELDEVILTGLLFWKPRKKNNLVLSIGAPSSPLISNFIMLEFDQIISNFCKIEKINYTRYADDITFSTNRKDLLFSVPKKVNSLLIKIFGGSIKVNNNKTVFTSKAHNRHVTGVTLTNNDTLSIGREKKRIISATIHKFSLNMLPDREVEKLRGNISYASYIEPEFFQRMIKKYGSEVLEKIRKHQS